MPKRLTLFLLTFFLMTAGMTHAADKTTSVEMKETKTAAPLFDLTLYLAPPPAQDSEQTKAEINELMKVQKSRTAEQVKQAMADQDESGFSFADVIGKDFNSVRLPLTAALLLKVHEAEGDLTDPAKDYYHRPRPFLFDKRIEPCVKKSKSFSYPSGHATGGTAMAVILAHMVPEKKDALLARGLSYSENRIVGGAHYRTDIVAGQRAGVLLADYLMRDPEFQGDYEKAKAELRGVLGLK